VMLFGRSFGGATEVSSMAALSFSAVDLSSCLVELVAIQMFNNIDFLLSNV